MEDGSDNEHASAEPSSRNDSRPDNPVPVDILLTPPTRVLVITGPNTGGKTVALKTAGLLAVMAQAGLHIPADKGSRLPVFKSVFADIGDEQSISASLSTFSAHITNVVSMDRNLALPSLVLLDEVGAGTDPVEGGALGTAVIDHFRQRGAHLIATTHYDSLKSYASTTEGVVSAAFGFNPADVRADLQADLRIARPQPGHRDRRAARDAAGCHRRGAREPDRAREAARRASRARRSTTCARSSRSGSRRSAERMAVAEAERKLRAREDCGARARRGVPQAARRQARRSAARGARRRSTPSSKG